MMVRELIALLRTLPPAAEVRACTEMAEVNERVLGLDRQHAEDAKVVWLRLETAGE